MGIAHGKTHSEIKKRETSSEYFRKLQNILIVWSYSLRISWNITFGGSEKDVHWSQNWKMINRKSLWETTLEERKRISS